MYPAHHALLYIGVASFDLADFSKQVAKTHDVIVQRYSEFRINDARSLVTLATQTPMHQAKQCFVIMADTIATEAQNALLKLLEEPPAISSFVFVLPQNTLLPTLRSRFMIMNTEPAEVVFSPTFQVFIAEAVPKRLSRLATLIEKKEVETLTTLREDLLLYLSRQRRALTVAQVRRLQWLVMQMPLRGASTKMLFEDVAFTLPVEDLRTT